MGHGPRLASARAWTAAPMRDDASAPLVAETAEQRIGPRWLAEVRAACLDVSRRFDPAVYAVVERAWTRSELDDLEQEVVLEQLLRQGQLDYILDIAESLSDVQRLLRLRVRRQLAARRRRTVIDRLLVRIGAILDDAGYEQQERSEPPRFQPAGSGLRSTAPTEADLGRAAAAVRFLPTSDAGGDRAPAVYRSEVLRRLVDLCFEHSVTGLAIGDFDRILRLALTSWYPVLLDIGEGQEWLAEWSEPEPRWDELVQHLMSALPDADKIVLHLKLSGASDSQLAERLGVSRPTAAKERAAVFGRLREAWSHIAADLGPEQVARLAQEFYLKLEQEEWP